VAIPHLTGPPRPRTSRLVIAGILALTGALWIGQGLGYIPGSFMSGDPFWAAMGALLLVGAAVIVVVETRRPT